MSQRRDSVSSGALVALRRRRSDERAGNRRSHEARRIHATGRTASANVGRQQAAVPFTDCRRTEKLSRTTTIESITEKTTAARRSLYFVVLARFRRWKPRDDGSPHDRLPGSHLGARRIHGGTSACGSRYQEVGLGALGATQRGHALPLLSFDIQLPPHPLRPPVCDGRRRVSEELVTHGPLTATLLLDAFMRNHPEASVATYDFRAKSPLFANEQIHLVESQHRSKHS